MIHVVGVRFKTVGKIYYFDPGDISVAVGDGVIVETARGMEFGDVVLGEKELDETKFYNTVKKNCPQSHEAGHKTGGGK